MVSPVTDPELLRQLNAPEEQTSGTPVTDPEILKQLNADEPQNNPLKAATKPLSDLISPLTNISAKTEQNPAVLARGTAQGASLGWADEGAGVVGAVKDYLMGKGYDYAKNRDASRQLYEDAKKKAPDVYALGETIGQAPLMAVPGAAEASKLKALAGLTGLGAVTGLGNSAGDADQQLKDTVKGAAIGAGAGLVPMAAEAAVDPLSKLALNSGRRALGFTKRLLNREGLSAANKATQTMIDQGAIAPLGGAEATLARINKIGQDAGQNIGQIREMADVAGVGGVNKEDLANSVASKYTPEGTGGVYDKQQNAVNEMLDTINGTPTYPSAKPIPTIPEEQFSSDWSTVGDNAPQVPADNAGLIPFGKAERLKTTLQDAATDASGTLKEPIVSGASRMTREATENALGEATPELESIYGKPKQGDLLTEYLKDKNTYGASLDTKEAITDRVNAEKGNKFFTFRNAGDVITRRIPGVVSNISGNLSKILKDTPQVFGRFAPMLTSALSRGGEQGLAIAHYLNAQQNPDYQKQVEGLSQ